MRWGRLVVILLVFGIIAILALNGVAFAQALAIVGAVIGVIWLLYYVCGLGTGRYS